MMPLMAIPPIPMERAKSLKMTSVSMPAISGLTAANSGTTTHQMNALPAKMMKLYLRPMMNPRPRVAALTLTLKRNLVLEVKFCNAGMAVVEITSFHHPKELMRKS